MIVQLVGSFLFSPYKINQAKAAGTTYYVDNCNVTGNDTNNGTSASTPWLTINKVNTSSFNPGDSILFRRGCTWREQLTVPSSGSAGSPITFGAYGTGADPIISGADLITPGTSWSQSGTWSTALSITQSSNQTMTANLNFRSQISANAAAYSGTKIRLTVTANTSADTVISGMSIGVSTANDDFDAAPTRITFDGGSSTTTITANTTKVSDEITFTFDKTKRYLIQQYYLNGSKNIQESAGANFEYINYSAGSDMTMTQNMTANMTAAVFKVVSKIEIYNDTENVWSTALTTDPGAVFFDGVYGIEAVTLDSGRDWNWSANVLYVYSTSDPDTAYTDPGIEAAIREFCIDGSDQEYLTFQNLTLEKARTSNLRVDKQTNGGNIIIDMVVSNNAGTHGFHIDGESAKINTVTIKDSTVTNYARDIGATTYKGIYLDGSGGDNFTVQRCIITGDIVGPDTNMDRNGIEIITGDDVLIESNEVTGTDHGIVLKGATSQDWIIRYNYVHDTADDNLWFVDLNDADGKTYYNLFINAADNGADIRDCLNAGLMANNIFYNSVNWSILPTGADTNVNFKNNIVYRATETTDMYFIYHSTPIGSTFDNNIYYDSTGYCVGAKFAKVGAGSGETFATWQARPQDAHSLNADPLMTDPDNGDFTLQAGSPCINAGVDVGLTTDYAWNAVPKCSDSLPDIGAYEYQYDCHVTTGGSMPFGWTNPPIPGLNGFKCIINNNDASTNNREVNLTLEAGSNVKYAAVSEKEDMSGAGFESFTPEVFSKKFTLSIGDGLKKVYAQFLTAYNRFSDIVSDEIVLDTSSSANQEEQPKPEEQAEVPNVPETTTIVDGDLIRAINGFDVYIVKIIGDKKFKRLILNPDIFNQYEHLKWENVKEVGQIILDQYTTSDLVRALGDTKVYKLYANGDIGEKRWIKTLNDFISFGYDWGAVYMINNYERDSYKTGLDISSSQQ